MHKSAGEGMALAAIIQYMHRTALAIVIATIMDVVMSIIIIPAVTIATNITQISTIMIATTTTGINVTTGSMTVGTTINIIIAAVDTKNPDIASKGCPWVAFIISANMIRIR